MKKGKFVIISGPSGVGKDTICDELVKKGMGRYSVSMTTRKKRSNEIEGISYFFVSKEEFERHIFIMPPSFDELERRLRGRKSEDDNIISERLNIAKEEIKCKDKYDYIVINNTVDEAVLEIENIINNC